MNKWIILATWAVSICAVAHLSLDSPEQMPFSFTGADKAAHLLAYAWLAILPFFSFEKPLAACTGALFMIPYGIVLEFAQQLIPGREFSIADMAADAVGVILGMAAAGYVRETRRFTTIPSRSRRTAQ